MQRKFITAFFLSISLFFHSYSLAVLENSISPSIEKFECIENLPAHKYSHNQFKEITSALARKDEKIRLITYNMLLSDYCRDEINVWQKRLPRILELFEELKPDIIGAQELDARQVQELLNEIGTTYAFYSRSEGIELAGIFYRKDRFELVNNYVWYLTDTPEVPSYAALTMVHLRDLKTGHLFGVFNTHLSFSSVNKRDFQARFIADRLKENLQKMPTLFTGDLNVFPCRMDLEKLPFYDGDYVHRLLTKSGVINAKEVSILGHLGPLSTFTNDPRDSLPFKGLGTPGVFLDHIYVSPDITVLIHAVQPATVEGLFPSDHMPVLIDFMINE